MQHYPIALVTGGSSGLGKAWVEQLVEIGYEVVTISRNSTYFTDAVNKWASIEKIHPYVCDVRDKNSLSRLAQNFSTQNWSLDLLINNAAIYRSDDIGIPTQDVFRKVLETNLFSAIEVIRAFLPMLETSRSPSIINMSSGAGIPRYIDDAGPTAYRVSKAALNMVTCSFAPELKKKNVAIHCVDPGFVKTRINPHFGDDPRDAVKKLLWLVESHRIDLSGKLWKGTQEIPW